MSTDQRRSPAPWVDVDLSRDRDGFSVYARTSDGREERHRPARASIPDIKAFSLGVRTAATNALMLDAKTIEVSRQLYREIVDHALGKLLASTRREHEPLLVRLCVNDSSGDSEFSLHDVPWEALCVPEKTLTFWGTSANYCLVRRVPAVNTVLRGEILSALSLVSISPAGAAALQVFQAALDPNERAGEVRLLEILGDNARDEYLPGSLHGIADANIVHFVGHAGLVDRDGRSVPALFTADSALDDGPRPLPVEVFAQWLRERFSESLRLVVLECCEGAKRGDVASAGALLAAAGIGAVQAYQFPVRSDIAEKLSAKLIGSLASGNGDVGRAMQQARREMLGDSSFATAEVLGPVMYLPGPVQGAEIFDFTNRKLTPMAGGRSRAKSELAAIASPLEALLANPFSLILGDANPEHRKFVDEFRQKLAERLGRVPVSEWGPREEKDPVIPAGLPTSALAQQFAFRKSQRELVAIHRDQSGKFVDPMRDLLVALAPRLKEGVHVTLSHQPVLEEALVRAKPGARVYVLRPAPPDALSSEASLSTFDGGKWRSEFFDDVRLDLNTSYIVLRLFSGYLPGDEPVHPWLTEDDYLRGLRELVEILPNDVAHQVQGQLGNRPALCIGLSLRRWQHRVMLHRVSNGRGLYQGSVAIVDPESGERKLWEEGAGLPGKRGLSVVEISTGELGSILRDRGSK